MSSEDIIKKFKMIISCLPASAASKEKIELLLNEYKQDDGTSLYRIVEKIHELMFKDDENTTEKSIPDLLNRIFDRFDTLLTENVNDRNVYSEYEDIKSEVRQLFIELNRTISMLQSSCNRLELRVNQLEKMENNMNKIDMRNIANQLRNKMIRVVLPTLSRRAARDEYVEHLSGHEKFTELNDIIKNHNINLTVSDVARSIRALKRQRAIVAHDEKLTTNENVNTILEDFISTNDPYLNQQAKTVVYFLKVFADYLHEPLIVNLE